MTAGDPSDLLQDVTPARGQVKRVAASVLRILPALHQSSVLQPIDEGDQPARRQPKGLGDHALIHAGRLSQDAEHPRMPWSEVEQDARDAEEALDRALDTVDVATRIAQGQR